MHFKVIFNYISKTTVKYCLSAIAILVLVYTILWFVLLYPICNILNHQLDNSTSDQQHFTFSDITMHGFPFILGLKINELQENRKGIEVALSQPVYLEYSPFLGKLRIKYDGDIASKYKISTDQFDSIIHVQGLQYEFSIPSTLQNLYMLRADPMHLINAVQDISYTHKSLLVLNKLTKEKLYESLDQWIQVTKHDDRKDLDLRNTLPKLVKMTYKINNKSYVEIERLPAPTSILYGAFIPITIQSNGEIELSTHGQAIDDLDGAYRLRYNGAMDLELIKCNGQILYEQSNTKHVLQTKINVETNTGLCNALYRTLNSVQYFTANIDSKYHLDIPSLKILDSQIFKTLENRKYQIDGVLSFLDHGLEAITFSCINNLNAVYLDYKPIEMKQIYGKSDKGYEINLGINNANKVVPFITKLIIPSSIDAQLTDIARDAFSKANYFFLKSISEYPKAQSDNLLISVRYNGNKLKLGNKSLSEIVWLYNAALTEGIATYIADEQQRNEMSKNLTTLLTDWGMEFIKNKQSKKR